MNQPVDIRLIHPKLIKSHLITDAEAKPRGAITLREWRPGQEWVTHFRNLETGGYYYGRYFREFSEAEANFKQRIAETRRQTLN